jgi:Protein of unknown function (DUF4236)
MASLNLRKSGVSVSAGPLGAKVTVGQKGVRKTVGIPGTGLSHTEYTKYGSGLEPQESYCPDPDHSRASSDKLLGCGILLFGGLVFLFLYMASK